MSLFRRGSDAAKGGLWARATPYLVATAAFLLSTQGTVTGFSEYAELRAGLRLGDGDDLIRSAPATVQASLFPGKDVFESRHQLQRSAFQLGGLEAEEVPPADDAMQDVTGALAAPGEESAEREESKPYPVVNRANKGDRRVLADGSRRVKRANPRTGRMVTLLLPPRRQDEPEQKDEPAREDEPKRGAPAAPMPPNVAALAEKRARTAVSEERNRDLRCLAQAIYFEARGEPERGQLAVAQVVLNRVDHVFYPDNICDVVFQNQHRRHKCQFSFACDGRSDTPRNQFAWTRAIKLAKKSMNGQGRIEELGRSTHFHATYVLPNWLGDMVRLQRIGKHIFYRVRAWS